MKKLLLACTCATLLVSCGQNSAEYKKLKAENDSLKIENTKATSEMNEILSTLNDVEADIQSIRDAENYLNLQQQTGGEFSKSNREQIKQNMQLISETLKKNKETISQLEDKLKKIGCPAEDNQPPFFRTGPESYDDRRFAGRPRKEKCTYPGTGRNGLFVERRCGKPGYNSCRPI